MTGTVILTNITVSSTPNDIPLKLKEQLPLATEPLRAVITNGTLESNGSVIKKNKCQHRILSLLLKPLEPYYN